MSSIMILKSVIIALSCLSFISLLLPTEYQFISIGSLTGFATATTITVGVCALTTGIPCAIALGVTGLSSVLASLLTGYDLEAIPLISYLVNTSQYAWIGALILTPISIIITLCVADMVSKKG
jgi:hypothetical protein